MKHPSLEVAKIIGSYYQNLIVLNSGSIVLILTLFDKLAVGSQHLTQHAIKLPIGFLLASLCVAFLSQASLSTALLWDPKSFDASERQLEAAKATSWRKQVSSLRSGNALTLILLTYFSSLLFFVGILLFAFPLFQG